MRRRGMLIVVGCALAVGPGAASRARADDDKQVIRIASVAPEGTSWARELRAFAQDLKEATRGAVTVKLYLGGKAGDEMEVAKRIGTGQLDGAVSGGIMCGKVMPSMRVLRVPGVFADRDESGYVMREMFPDLSAEAAKAGFTLLSTGGLGPSVIFSREPVADLEALKKLRLWRWDQDDTAVAIERGVGMNVVPLTLAEAAKAYDDGKIDGFLAIPTAALAFQWYTQARYMTELRSDFLVGCVLIANRAMDALTDDQRRALQSAAAKLATRIDETGRKEEVALMTAIFPKQGLKSVPVSKKFRAEYFAMTRQSRVGLSDEILPRAALEQAMQLLADYRGEHRTKR